MFAFPWSIPHTPLAGESGLEPWQREVQVRLGNSLLARGFGAADFVEVVVPIECTACTRARPLCRYARIILRAVCHTPCTSSA
jgi:hypothetical protein